MKNTLEGALTECVRTLFHIGTIQFASMLVFSSVWFSLHSLTKPLAMDLLFLLLCYLSLTITGLFLPSQSRYTVWLARLSLLLQSLSLLVLVFLAVLLQGG